jgi:hypothetical protein
MPVEALSPQGGGCLELASSSGWSGSRGSMPLAARLIMIMRQLASFGLP